MTLSLGLLSPFLKLESLRFDDGNGNGNGNDNGNGNAENQWLNSYNIILSTSSAILL